MEDSGIDSDSKNKTRMDDGSDSSTDSTNNKTLRRLTTLRLQKKLEARIEQAKRIQSNSKYTKIPDKEPDICVSDCVNATYNSVGYKTDELLLPEKKNTTLIEYDHSDESEDETTIFPMKRESLKHKQDITDTFSIEELSDGSEDSLHLGTTPEAPQIRRPPKYFCCHCIII